MRIEYVGFRPGGWDGPAKGEQESDRIVGAQVVIYSDCLDELTPNPSVPTKGQRIIDYLNARYPALAFLKSQPGAWVVGVAPFHEAIDGDLAALLRTIKIREGQRVPPADDLTIHLQDVLNGFVDEPEEESEPDDDEDEFPDEE